jgi:membrane peptidoglycan carboxypeptidase
LQLATVYSTIASGGVYHKPYLITRINAHDGRVLEEVKSTSMECHGAVVDEYAIAELRTLLQQLELVDHVQGRQELQMATVTCGLQGLHQNFHVWSGLDMMTTLL